MGVKLRHDKDVNGKEMDVLETKYQDQVLVCKNCTKNPRANGASRCTECINKHKTFQNNQMRLQKKVEAQAKLSGNK